jgi:hypothetical protein
MIGVSDSSTYPFKCEQHPACKHCTLCTQFTAPRRMSAELFIAHPRRRSAPIHKTPPLPPPLKYRSEREIRKAPKYKIGGALVKANSIPQLR